jgi:hypothetical protein
MSKPQQSKQSKGCTDEPKIVHKAFKDVEANRDDGRGGSKEGYITLDIGAKRLKVCKELSMHQQPLFTKSGINPIVKNLLARQEKE